MSFSVRLTVAIVLLAAAGGLLYEQRRGMHPERDSVARVAVVPFDNLTGDPSIDWASRALAAAVVRQVEGLPRVRAFYADTSNRAVALGATHIVYGTLVTGSGDAGVKAWLEIAARHRMRSEYAANHTAGDWLSASRNVAQWLGGELRPGAPLLPLDVSRAEGLHALGESLWENDSAAKLAVLERGVADDPACGYCWEALFHVSGQSGGAEAAQKVMARAGAVMGQLPEASRLRLELLRRSSPAERRGALQRLAQLIPGEPTLQIQLAEMLVSARQPAQAAEAYRRALDADPTRSELLNMLGYSVAWTGKFDEALKLLKKYAEAEPESANPPDSIGEIQLMAGRFAEAEKSFLESNEKDPSFNGGVALEKAALARWLSGDRKGAGELLERYMVTRTKLRDPLVVLRRARWQYLLGQAAEAQANLRLLASRPGEPGAALAASYLSIYALQSGREEEARSLAAVARGMARDSLSMFAANVAGYLAAPGPDPVAGAGDALQQQLKAMALTLHGDLEQATEAWQKALERTPSGSDALPREMLAQVLVARGKSNEASELVKPGWPLLTPDQMLLFDSLVYPNLFFVRGAVAQQASNNEAARKYYEQFLQSVGSRPDPLGMARKARAAVRL